VNSLLSNVSDVPDGAGTVVCDKETAIFGDSNTYRPSPDSASLAVTRTTEVRSSTSRQVT
jgi:hypothetical protein